MGRHRRVLVFVGIVVVCVVGLASPADAHGGGGDDATNYRIEVVDAGDPGLRWRVYGGEAVFELTNQTGQEVVVVGYRGEPYLWFVPGEGVYENELSPTVHLNRDRYGETVVPDWADPTADPRWRQVSDGSTASWHDHRAHWMSRDDPVAVASNPDREQLVFEWSIPLLVGSGAGRHEVLARGELWWVPGVAWWPPMVVTASVFALVVGVAAWRTRPSGRAWVGLSRPVTVVVWLVCAANVLRTVDDLVSVPATRVEQVIVVAVSVLTVAGVVALSTKGWRGHPGGFAALAGAGLLLALLFGGESSDQLSASQVATELPICVRRWTVAASYTVAVATHLAAGIGAVWYARSEPAPHARAAAASGSDG